MLSLLSSDPLLFVIVAVCLVLSLTLHEWGHAKTADLLGDDTPRRFGRVTLNPAAHLDVFGAILLIVVGFGFARPVPVNFARVGRWGGLAVAAAGPVMNILLALVSLLLLRFAAFDGLLQGVFSILFSLNLTLAIFNLLPIPLLDGSRIVAALFPRTLGRALFEFERLPYAFLIVLLFILVGSNQILRVIGYFQGLAFGLVGLS